jgi:hypothetical protein
MADGALSFLQNCLKKKVLRSVLIRFWVTRQRLEIKLRACDECRTSSVQGLTQRRLVRKPLPGFDARPVEKLVSPAEFFSFFTFNSCCEPCTLLSIS